MATVHLTGSIPVTVVVDTDRQRVTKVLAHDACFQYGAEAAEVEITPRTVWKGKLAPAIESVAAEARAIAESDAVWPPWEWC